MKEIEDTFQALGDQIINGLAHLDRQQSHVVTRFFALWSLRVELLHDGVDRDVAIKGVSGEPLTKDEQEQLEKAGVAYIRSDLTIPRRFMSGVQIQIRIHALSAQLAGAKWGVVTAEEGEFLCPDSFGRLAAVPVTPRICLYLGHDDTNIPKPEVARRNAFAQQSVRRYCIARDFAACPL